MFGTQELVAKIIKEEEAGVKFIAVADGMEWTLYSSNNRNIGDFVTAYVFSYTDEDYENNSFIDCEFYLEDTGAKLSNKLEWEKQEKNHLL